MSKGGDPDRKTKTEAVKSLEQRERREKERKKNGKMSKMTMTKGKGSVKQMLKHEMISQCTIKPQK